MPNKSLKFVSFASLTHGTPRKRGAPYLKRYALFMIARLPVSSEVQLGGYAHFTDGHIR